MTAKERGFLLLACHLGEPERPVLTPSQLRTLAQRVRVCHRGDAQRELHAEDLRGMGYGAEAAERIVALLSQEALLEAYVRRGARAGCVPLSRIGADYPPAVHARLGLDSPACLWAKGNLALLHTPMVALAGSRELEAVNRDFAQEVGYQAARQGYTLVSGNARGADRAAQDACLNAGGAVICVVADELQNKAPGARMLCLSEEGFELAFSSRRALSRNRVIHSLGQCVFIAQCGYRMGGTWDGTMKNLRAGWSPVWCFRDGSRAQQALEQLGAVGITRAQLADFTALRRVEQSRLF